MRWPSAIAVLGFIGITVIGSVVGRAVQQDFEYGIHPFFFTAPIRKRDYFFGRLLGAWLTLVMIFLGIALGVLIGTHWPGVDAGARRRRAVLAELRAAVPVRAVPNVLWLGGCFFVLAALTRQMAPVYVGGVIALVGYLFAMNLIGDMENKTLAAMIDPVGRHGRRRADALLERRPEERPADPARGRAAVESADLGRRSARS